MNLVVFTGPTLPAEAARLRLDATYLPPAAAGDLYRAARAKPFAIGLIDGYFDRVPSVFHKEILWALREGIHVVGAASMGALRAAELDVFGMQGVGRVFEAFRSGTLRDDDEVAVAHLLADGGFAIRSEAMINVRATVAAARVDGVIDDRTADAVLRVGKALFYPERTYPVILDGLRDEEVDAGEISAFERWLAEHGPIDQKREDALELLSVLRDLAERAEPPPAVRWDLAHTAYWQNVVDECDADLVPTLAETDATHEDVLDELRIDAMLPAVWNTAVAQLLARSIADREGYAFDETGLATAANEFWTNQGVNDTSAKLAWQRERRVDDARLRRLLVDEAYRRWGERGIRFGLREAVVSQLQLSPYYPRLLERAERKRRALTERGLAGVDDPVGIDDDELWRWWFEARGATRPLDLDSYATSLGFSDDAAFRRVVIDEYHVTTQCGGPGLVDGDLVRRRTTEPPRAPEPSPEPAESPDISVPALRAALRAMVARLDGTPAAATPVPRLDDDDFQRHWRVGAVE